MNASTVLDRPATGTFVVTGCALMSAPACDEGDPGIRLEFDHMPSDLEVLDGVKRGFHPGAYAQVGTIRFRIGNGPERSIAPN